MDDKIKIETDGNVGPGTAFPTVQLDIGGGPHQIMRTQPESFSFAQLDSEPLLTLHHDGRVSVSDRFSPTEIAARVLGCIVAQWPALIERARNEGRDEVRSTFSALGYEIINGVVCSVRKVPIVVVDK